MIYILFLIGFLYLFLKIRKMQSMIDDLLVTVNYDAEIWEE